VRKLREQIR